MRVDNSVNTARIAVFASVSLASALVEASVFIDSIYDWVWDVVVAKDDQIPHITGEGWTVTVFYH